MRNNQKITLKKLSQDNHKSKKSNLKTLQKSKKYGTIIPTLTWFDEAFRRHTKFLAKSL
ncbi:MAG: hypothetical protein ACOX5E_04705 [Bacilli bacterium]